MSMEFTLQSKPLDTLLVERFHISTGFHPEQRNIIERLIAGQRILAIQRTGWGKSLCYQMASLYYPHLTIVFSPLKALMRDQYQRCNDVYAIPAAIVSSDFTSEENRATLARAVAGHVKILFIAPERLDEKDWQTSVSQMRISMIVIDEAHCISTWGHDFRPSYRRIVNLLNAIPKNTPVLALTATANQRVEQDILAQIGTEVKLIRGTMQRKNLYLNVVSLQGDWEKLSYLAEMLPLYSGTGIIYTATKSSAEMVAAFLIAQGIDATYYHGSRDDTIRQDIERKLCVGCVWYVGSTNALGMGIDKQDLRFVIHYHVPASPIHYYQEMGRAGRDGKVAWCILLYDPADMAIQEHFIHGNKPQSHCYETILVLLRQSTLGLHDIMRKTGYAQTSTKVILEELEEQRLIEHDVQKRTYSAKPSLIQVDFSAHSIVRQHKERELDAIKQYIGTQGCYMEYLTTYLGDQPGYSCRVCGHCLPSNFPIVKPSKRIEKIATKFLEEDFLPVIEKKGTVKQPIHEAGRSLSYHGKSQIGRLVSMSKYEGAGPFSLMLVRRSVEVIRTYYPIEHINGIVNIPPTRSGMLVEQFARQVATELGIEYLAALKKVRSTEEQKTLSNWVQKKDNVKGAFEVLSPHQVSGRTLLLIDDIYDSGYMMREVALTLMQAGARVVYPFTITRTAHSDDQ